MGSHSCRVSLFFCFWTYPNWHTHLLEWMRAAGFFFFLPLHRGHAYVKLYLRRHPQLRGNLLWRLYVLSRSIPSSRLQSSSSRLGALFLLESHCACYFNWPGADCASQTNELFAAVHGFRNFTLLDAGKDTILLFLFPLSSGEKFWIHLEGTTFQHCLLMLFRSLNECCHIVCCCLLWFLLSLQPERNVFPHFIVLYLLEACIDALHKALPIPLGSLLSVHM